MCQVTWMMCTENLDVKGPEMAVNKYEILCWQLLLMVTCEYSGLQMLLMKSM